jgi:hypothetical protein
MKLQIELTDKDFEFLWQHASSLGYRRVEPKKRWSLREKKEAVRFAIARMADLTPRNLREE